MSEQASTAIVPAAGTARKDPVLPVPLKDANGPVVVFVDHYAGIASRPFSQRAQDVLMADPGDDDIDVLPTTGAVYVGAAWYRDILNRAFGVGGWGMKPISDWDMKDNTLSREWVLYCEGRFAASARGEQDYIPSNENTSEATAAEGAESNALMRCCKHLGITNKLWMKSFARKWLKEHAVEVWCVHAKEGRKKKLWRRKDAPPFEWPWKEGKDTGRQDPEPATGTAPSSNEPAPGGSQDTTKAGKSAKSTASASGGGGAPTIRNRLFAVLGAVEKDNKKARALFTALTGKEKSHDVDDKVVELLIAVLYKVKDGSAEVRVSGTYVWIVDKPTGTVLFGKEPPAPAKEEPKKSEPAKDEPPSEMEPF